LVLGLGCGSAFAAVMEFADRSFRAAAHLTDLTGLPVLGVVPIIITEGDRRKRRRRMLIIGSAATLGLILSIVLIHFLVRPLDIIWFDVMRRVKFILA
jgi:hypothetical protein